MVFSSIWSCFTLEGNLEATCKLCSKRLKSARGNLRQHLKLKHPDYEKDTETEVAPSDKVCPMCRINVRNFYDFRIMCLQSDARIKSWMARGEQANLSNSTQKPDQTVRIYKRVRRPVPPPVVKSLGEGQSSLSRFGRKDGQSDVSLAKERRLSQMICVRPDSRKDSETGNNVEKQVKPSPGEHNKSQTDVEFSKQSKKRSLDVQSGACMQETIVPDIKNEVEEFDVTADGNGTEERDVLDTKDVKPEVLDGNEIIEEEPKDERKGNQTKGDKPKEDDITLPLIQIVKTETLMEADFGEESGENESVFCKEPDFQEVKEEPVEYDDTENMEVLVDPLMVVDEATDAENQSKRHEYTLSPVLGGGGEANKKNGHVLYPSLNGALSDEQRALDFVRKHLRKDRTPSLPEDPVSPPPQGVDPLEKPFKCTSCSGSFAYYKSFVKHRNRHSGFDTPYECPHCPESFATNKEMHVHFREHAEKQFCCDRCYRSFPSQERLDAHNFLHSGNKPHLCETCVRSFSYRSSYALHMRKVHGTEVTVGTYLRCHKCPTEWSSTAELKEHILEIHESEETDSGSTCEVCAMRFLSKAILNVHSRIHQGIRPFK